MRKLTPQLVHLELAVSPPAPLPFSLATRASPDAVTALGGASPATFPWGAANCPPVPRAALLTGKIGHTHSIKSVSTMGHIPLPGAGLSQGSGGRHYPRAWRTTWKT
ncbi:hypothetical protein BaRGS_00025755 [Batillaria attramentaria]|uniref:Uncharacterized protein n=1 Tax=Batillaria attramentaria TaxID=370345 RepID=A0ABD0K7L9_9CAEN